MKLLQKHLKVRHREIITPLMVLWEVQQEIRPGYIVLSAALKKKGECIKLFVRRRHFLYSSKNSITFTPEHVSGEKGCSFWQTFGVTRAYDVKAERKKNL